MDCQNNDQLKYPPELFADTYRAYPNLLAWWADLAVGSHPNNLFKLIICGNGTVGKTKIARRVVTGEYEEKGESTHGVQLYLTAERSFAADYPAVRLHIWDFAGQEIYYQLHRLFFRQRAVYLIVYDRETWMERFQLDPVTGRQDENRSIDYWLNDIRASARNAPILLVQNKLDTEGVVDVKARLPEDLRHLTPIQLSAKSGTRFGELLVGIHQAIAGLPRADMQIPQSWWEVREEILRLQLLKGKARVQLLSIEDFYALCREKNLCEGSEGALLTYLDGCGVILYDDKLFPEKLVIDQQWALDAIYTVLERIEEVPKGDWHKYGIREFQKNCALNNGLFVADDLPFSSEYTPAEKELFLKIMLRARICFKTNAKENGEPLYLLFHFLREARPEKVLRDWSAKSGGGVLSQRFVFTHYLHKGIFRELVQKLFDKVSLEQLWQEGLLLTWRDTMALVTVNYAENQSYLEISGAGDGHLVQHLLSAFRNLLKEPLQQTSGHQLYLSNDGTNWIEREEIEKAKEMEAKFAPTVAGGKSDQWRDLLWVLRQDDKADFSEVPAERHQDQVDALTEPETDIAKEMKRVRELLSAGKELLVVIRQLKPLVPPHREDIFSSLSAEINKLAESQVIGIQTDEQLSIMERNLRSRLLTFSRMLG